jgi:hypothetical protein
VQFGGKPQFAVLALERKPGGEVRERLTDFTG